MRSSIRAFACPEPARRKPAATDPLLVWARRCAASPASFGATPAEGRIVAALLADIEAGR